MLSSGRRPLIYGSDSVVDMDDLDRAFDDGWFELIWFSDLSHFLCYTGAYSPFQSRFVDSPLICMIILSFEIHIRLMIWFHCVLILRGASLESLSQIHIFWYSRDSWTELSQVRGFPHHHFSGVHLRSFICPPWNYSRLIRTDLIYLTLYWGIFPSFSCGDDRSLTNLL